MRKCGIVWRDEALTNFVWLIIETIDLGSGTQTLMSNISLGSSFNV